MEMDDRHQKDGGTTMKLLVRDNCGDDIYGILTVRTEVTKEVVDTLLDKFRSDFDEDEYEWSVEELIERMQAVGIDCDYEALPEDCVFV
jgi:hypothetical protein